MTTLDRLRKLTADTDTALVAAVLATQVPGLGIDPWLAAIIIGALMAEDEHPEESRRLTLDEWKPRIRAKLREWKRAAEAAPVVTEAPSVSTPVQATQLPFPALPGPTVGAPVEAATPTATSSVIVPAGPVDALPVDLPAPPAPPVVPGAPAASGLPIPAPPPGLPEPLREAWIQARVRAGEYARGLGSVIRRFPEDVAREGWEGEQLTAPVDERLRESKLRAIREATSEAVAKRWTPERLASELGHKTGEWSRNWLRVARTELQAAHDEGVAITGLRNYGTDARCAKVPESSACADCKRLYLEPDGSPKVFGLVEILENGTNVGKPREEWAATCWPAHPACVCALIIVPPGMTVTKHGALRPEAP